MPAMIISMALWLYRTRIINKAIRRSVVKRMNTSLLSILYDVIERILPFLASDDYSHEDEVLYGAALGVLLVYDWMDVFTPK